MRKNISKVAYFLILLGVFFCFAPSGRSEDFISSVKQDGKRVQVYNGNGVLLWSREGQVVGYTSNSLSVMVNKKLFVYNNKGTLQYTR